MRLVNAASGGTRLSSAALRESSTHRVASGFARLTAEAPKPRMRAKARVFRCGRTYDQRMALRDRCEWVVLSVTCLRLYGRVLGVVTGFFIVVGTFQFFYYCFFDIIERVFGVGDVY